MANTDQPGRIMNGEVAPVLVYAEAPRVERWDWRTYGIVAAAGAMGLSYFLWTFACTYLAENFSIWTPSSIDPDDAAARIVRLTILPLMGLIVGGSVLWSLVRKQSYPLLWRACAGFAIAYIAAGSLEWPLKDARNNYPLNISTDDLESMRKIMVYSVPSILTILLTWRRMDRSPTWRGRAIWYSIIVAAALAGLRDYWDWVRGTPEPAVLFSQGIPRIGHLRWSYVSEAGTTVATCGYYAFLPALLIAGFWRRRKHVLFSVGAALVLLGHVVGLVGDLGDQWRAPLHPTDLRYSLQLASTWLNDAVICISFPACLWLAACHPAVRGVWREGSSGL